MRRTLPEERDVRRSVTVAASESRKRTRTLPLRPLSASPERVGAVVSAAPRPPGAGVVVWSSGTGVVPEGLGVGVGDGVVVGSGVGVSTGSPVTSSVPVIVPGWTSQWNV